MTDGTRRCAYLRRSLRYQDDYGRIYHRYNWSAGKQCGGGHLDINDALCAGGRALADINYLPRRVT